MYHHLLHIKKNCNIYLLKKNIKRFKRKLLVIFVRIRVVIKLKIYNTKVKETKNRLEISKRFFL